jgi:RHS repeat-associated protein
LAFLGSPTYRIRETTQFSARLAFAFFGDEATLTMGTGPDHSIYDIYIDGSLWQSIDGYAAAAGTRSIVMTTGIDGRKLAMEGLHTVELRNRAERHSLATGYKLRFQQGVVADKTYTAQTIRYSYDKLARVREARYAAGVNGLAADADLLRRYQYAFDVAGNRTQQSVALNGAAPTVTNYTYNAGNQLTSDGTNSFTYDNNGNLVTRGGGLTHTWDRANRLANVNYTGATYTYSYDGEGRMYRQRYFSPSNSNEIVDQHLLDVQPGLALVLSRTRTVTQPGNSFSDTQRYLYSPRGIHGQQFVGGGWYWAMQDGLGSVRGGANSAGQTWGSQSYAPFGEIFDQTGNDGIEHGFTGELVSSNNMLFLRARHYDPVLGIFPSLDPFEGMVQRAMSLNGYSWVEGNVANAVDPSGMQIPLPLPPPVRPPPQVLPFVQPYVPPIGIPGVSPAQSAGALNQSELIRLAMLEPINADLHRYISEVFGFCPLRLPNRSLRENETDCLQGRTRQEAARDYAWSASFYYQSVVDVVRETARNNPEEYGLGLSTGITIAFTEVKLRESPVCVRLAAMNNREENGWTNFTIKRWQLGRALFAPLANATGTIYNAPDLVQLNHIGIPGGIVVGHAEANLYDLVQFPAFDQSSFVALGISNTPCSYDSSVDCSTWLRSSLPTVAVAYMGSRQSSPMSWN